MTLEEAKILKTVEIKKEHDEDLHGLNTYTHNGKTISIVTGFELLYRFGVLGEYLKDNGATSAEIRNYDDTKTTLSYPDEFDAMIILIRDDGVHKYGKKDRLLDMIADATTIEEVEALTWNY